MVKWWQVGGVSNADLADATEVAKALQPWEATWKVSQEPFFDSRLIVETSALFIAASFRIRVSQAGDEKHEAKLKGSSDFDQLLGRGSPSPAVHTSGSQFKLRHAACCHAHHFMGFDRLATELVPRCRPLRDQLKQTLQSLCVQRGKKKAELEELLDSEVDRFLRSRLVVCRLTDVMTPDIIAKYDSESESEDDEHGGLEGHGIFNVTAVSKGRPPWKDALFGDVGGRRGPPPVHPLGAQVNLSKNQLANKLQQMRHHALAGHLTTSLGGVAGGVAEAARRTTRMERRQRAKEKGMRLFEHRFFRAFTVGLGQSLFGDREDLVFRFEVAAMNVLQTYQGELSLALHSLMGWLPAHVSKSLFLVISGLPAMVAAKQGPEKFGMLLKCVNCIASGSGRYVFVSTPSWYLPLSARIAGLGRLHEIREASLAMRGRPITSVQSVWPSPCEPQEVIAAVEAIWGGRIAGVRAALGLCGGVEAMGEWVLRMTMGCHGLLLRALEVLKDMAVRYEDAYDELVAEMKFQSDLEVPSHKALARCLAEMAADAINERAKLRRRQVAADASLGVATTDDFLLPRQAKPDFKKSATSVQSPPTNLGKRNSLVDETPISPSIRRRPGEKPNILAQLQRGDMTGGEDNSHLRRSVVANNGGVRLPVGAPGRMGGRIPIHDSPDLRPDVAPPIVEDVELPEVAPARIPCTLQRTQTAPQLRHPKSFAEQLAEMAALSKRSHQGVKKRARSAPAQVDTRDFDAGDLMKNTAVALALQGEISKVLSMECSEGPLNLFWRQGRGSERKEAAELTRLRLSCGAILLFASLRNAFPSVELPLKHFAPTETIGVKDEPEVAPEEGEEPEQDFSVRAKEAKEKPAPPVSRRIMATLADGAFAMGFSVIFHSMPSTHFARTSPLGSGVFHISLPQAMLEEQVLQDVLTHRCAGPYGETWMAWTTGSLLVLLSKYLLEEEHTASRYWTRLAGWLQQQHHLFFSTSCCLRVLLAFELLNEYYVLRPEDKLIRLKEVFPFLSKLVSSVKDLPAKLDMCADFCQRPLLHAPKICAELPGSRSFDANFAEWGKEFIPGGLAVDLGVPLMDFAKWVGHLKPGRIIYASPNASADWDLLLRLNWSVVIISFHAARNQELTGEKLFRMYRRSVGEPNWWGKRVRSISHIVMADRLAFELEALFPSTLQCVEVPGGCTMPGGSATAGGRKPKTTQTKTDDDPDAVDDEMEDEEVEEESPIPTIDKSKSDKSAEINCIEVTERCDFVIRPGSELLLCRASEGLERLLGPMANAVLGHRRSFDKEISQELSGEQMRDAAKRRAELNRARWSQDKSRLACRQPLPTASEKQLTFNMEALRNILDHIYNHTTSMQRLTSEINSESEDNSVLGSFASSVLPPIGLGSRQGSDPGDGEDKSDTGTSTSSSMMSSNSGHVPNSASFNPELLIGERRHSFEVEEVDIDANPPARRRASLHWTELKQSARLMLWSKLKRRRGLLPSLNEDAHGEDPAPSASVRMQDEEPVPGVPVAREVAHFEEGTAEPLRTAKRREWQPPTPHPAQSTEAARRTNPAAQRAFKERLGLQAPQKRGLKFDWLGWGS